MTRDLKFGPEWAFLELLCVGLDQPGNQEQFDELLTSGTLNWGEVLEQTIRHKMETMVAYHLAFSSHRSHVPVRILRHLRTVYDVNLYRRERWYATVANIVRALEAKGIPVSGRKQVCFEGTLYKGNGSRRLGDIDLMILPEHMKATTQVMNELGFEAAQYDWMTDKIIPIPRREMMIYRMSPDHLPIMMFRTGDQVTRFFDVDFASSMTWSKSEYEIPIEDALATVKHLEVPGLDDITIPAVSMEYELIGTVMHLFREAWFERWLDWEQDVDLAKFGDVIRIWRACSQNVEEIKTLIDRYEIRKPMLWVLEHMDRAFDTGAVAALGWEGQLDEDFLTSAHSSSGDHRQWTGSMRERLFAKDRKALFLNGEAANV